MHRRIVLAAALCGALSAVTPIHAQTTGTCTYTECALRFEPGNWGMRLVRGAAGRPVGWIRPFNRSAIDTLLRGPDSAATNARLYVNERKKVDAYGLIGTASLVFGLVHAHNGREVHAVDWAALALGFLTLGPAGKHGSNASAALSRSVWWYNAGLPH